MHKHLGLIGAIITAAYVVTVLMVTWYKLPTLPGMELNEVGDFLAGVFGPLAILWLVLGFFQQGEELKQNTAALKLQADELAAAVAQHKAMAEATKEQVKLMAAGLDHNEALRRKTIEPVLYIKHERTRIVSNAFKFAFVVINRGGTCIIEQVSARNPGVRAGFNAGVRTLLKDIENQFLIEGPESALREGLILIDMKYRDDDSTEITKILEVRHNNDGTIQTSMA